ncbi:mitochondrial amidoxime-reducing component 1 isoform X2 [Cephus cinctus]|uniref:Mitochondrial amidoxime-reducing component 1 isoform X2 n=1 Tax=Cephus cinctus TaxID=211228 RepID=A0AAJ7BS81_CEPCN|nr:mitochondrial amidoxime-reducing component 1 isoform X2 [Cephus cinctus]
MESLQSNKIVFVLTCGVAVALGVAVWISKKNSRQSENSASKQKPELSARNREDNGHCKTDKSNSNSVQKNKSQVSDVGSKKNVEAVNEFEEVKKDGYIKNVETEMDMALTDEEQAIDELPDPKWLKVGKIKEIFYYPLKSGRGKDVKQCHFTEYGISVTDTPGNVVLRDRMFLVYNEETGQFRTGRNFPTLVLVTLSAVDDSHVKLEAVGMPALIFSIPKEGQPVNGNTSSTVECKMWWGEPLKCIDCGNEASKWISRFLIGTNSGLRIGYACPGTRRILEGPWKRFAEVYNTLRNEDTGLFSDLASYMLMTESSVNVLNKKLDRPVPALQFRPNIVVEGPEAFAEDNWEWIKIGSQVVIRNVKPCPRHFFRFRSQKDSARIAVDGKAPTMGINCGLYKTGSVQVGDDVYVHIQSEKAVQDTSAEK